MDGVKGIADIKNNAAKVLTRLGGVIQVPFNGLGISCLERVGCRYVNMYYTTILS